MKCLSIKWLLFFSLIVFSLQSVSQRSTTAVKPIAGYDDPEKTLPIRRKSKAWGIVDVDGK